LVALVAITFEPRRRLSCESLTRGRRTADLVPNAIVRGNHSWTLVGEAVVLVAEALSPPSGAIERGLTHKQRYTVPRDP
jgi:hypothetical protein